MSGPGFFGDKKGTPQRKPLVLDIKKSLAARDHILKKMVAKNPKLTDQVAEFVSALPIGWKGYSEDIRLLGGFGECNPKAWGPVIGAMKRRKLLTETGNWKEAESVARKGSKIFEYVRI